MFLKMVFLREVGFQKKSEHFHLKKKTRGLEITLVNRMGLVIISRSTVLKGEVVSAFGQTFLKY